MTRSSSVVVAAMLLLACSAKPEDVPPPLEGTYWRLSSLPGHDIAAGTPMSLQVEAARIAGGDGCNRFTGPVEFAGAEIRIDPGLARTRMACPDDVQARADAYLLALGQSARYRVVEATAPRRLELLAPNGAVLMVFDEASQSLAGTRWDVTAINDGRQAVVSVLEGTRVSLAFDAEGRVSGSAGCNRFTARYEAGPGTLRIEPPGVTRRACPEPGVLRQEQAFLRALEAARVVHIEAGRLELRDADGALQVSAQAATGSP